MKTSLILLLIIFTMAACAPQSKVTPINNPSLIPVTDATPVATVVPVTGTLPVTTDIPVATSVQVCTCPTSMTTPPAAQGGVINPDTVICNCPAILVPPPVATTGIGSSPQTIPANGINLGDNGKTFILQPGESFLLNLGTTDFNWTVSVDNQNVLSRERNIMVIRGAQGVYQAAQPGQAVLSAVGDPICQNSKTVCMALAVFFKVTIIVK
jgi:hypothetical protein